jgi:myo-inositol 2-dehydrogenase/D-chiro-inositol 1-dehydrogenase
MSRSASYGYDQRCEIFGSEGLVSIGNIHETSTVISSPSGIAHSKLQHSFPERFHQAFGTELDAFADTLLLGTPWPVTAEQCVNVQKVADAALKSAETGVVVMVGAIKRLREGGKASYHSRL